MRLFLCILLSVSAWQLTKGSIVIDHSGGGSGTFLINDGTGDDSVTVATGELYVLPDNFQLISFAGEINLTLGSMTVTSQAGAEGTFSTHHLATEEIGLQVGNGTANLLSPGSMVTLTAGTPAQFASINLTSGSISSPSPVPSPGFVAGMTATGAPPTPSLLVDRQSFTQVDNRVDVLYDISHNQVGYSYQFQDIYSFGQPPEIGDLTTNVPPPGIPPMPSEPGSSPQYVIDPSNYTIAVESDPLLQDHYDISITKASFESFDFLSSFTLSSYLPDDSHSPQFETLIDGSSLYLGGLSNFSDFQRITGAIPEPGTGGLLFVSIFSLFALSPRVRR